MLTSLYSMLGRVGGGGDLFILKVWDAEKSNRMRVFIGGPWLIWAVVSGSFFITAQ